MKIRVKSQGRGAVAAVNAIAMVLGCVLWAGVASAQVTNVYNLTTATVTNADNSTVPVTTTLIGSQVVTGAWLQGTAGSGGSGDVFVRTGAGGSGSGVYRRLFSFGENDKPDPNDLTVMQSGYNRGGAFDASAPGGFDPYVTVGQMNMSNLTSDGSYYVLAMDINETGGGQELSLDDFQIWTGPNLNPTIPTTTAGLTNLGTQRYAMNNSVTQSFVLSSGVGSGAGNLFLFVEKSLLTGAAASDYVFFYVSVGQYDVIINARDDRFGWNNGFEEFALLYGSGEQVPEPPTVAAAALALFGCLVVASRRRRCGRTGR